jgi:hypothetical protein
MVAAAAVAVAVAAAAAVVAVLTAAVAAAVAAVVVQGLGVSCFRLAGLFGSATDTYVTVTSWWCA